MKYAWVLKVFVCSVLLLPSAVDAQLFKLLDMAEVHQQLKLDPGQIEKCQEIKAELERRTSFALIELVGGARYEQLSTAEQREFRQKSKVVYQDIDALQDERLSELMNEPQIRRLQQLRIQALGPSSFLNGEIRQKLEITDEQVAALEALVPEFRNSFAEKVSKNDGGSAAARPDSDAINRQYVKELKAALLAGLNEEQQQQYRRLIGELAEIPIINGLR